MGKLHSLRRAIERDPKSYGLGHTTMGYVGAIRAPVSCGYNWRPILDYGMRRGHRKFILKVLKELEDKVKCIDEVSG